MYLSYLPLRLRAPLTRGMIADPQVAHAAVESAFPPSHDRILWRLTPERDAAVLLVVSPTRPVLDDIHREAGWPDAPAQTAELPADRFTAGQCLTFTLTADPTRKETGSNKRVPVRSVPEQLDWLQRKADHHGFVLLAATVAGTRTKKVRSTKASGRTWPITQVDFQGTLEITDPEKFYHALTTGIGSSRFAGCGLLGITSAA